MGRTRGMGMGIGGVAFWLAVACNGGSTERQGADAAAGDDASADAADIDARPPPPDPWTLQLIGPWSDEVQFAAAAGDNSVVVAGDINESAVLGGESMTADGETNAFFVARITADGDVLWAHAFGGNAPIILGDLAVGPAGDAYVTGRFKGTIDLGGPDPIVAVGDTFDFFVARYAAADGALVWAKDYGGPAWDAGTALDVTAEGDVVVGGYFAGYVQFGGDFLESTEGRDVFLASYAAEDGAHRWSRLLPGPVAEELTSLEVLGDGSLLAGGFLWTESGTTRVAWLSPDGVVDRASEVGTGVLYVWAAEADGDDAIVAGTFQGDVTIGDENASNGDVGSFFARVAGADRTVTWATLAGDEGVTAVLDLALVGDGRVLGAGFLLGGRVTFGGDVLDIGDGQAALLLELDAGTGDPGGGAIYGHREARSDAVTARPDGGVLFCGTFREDIDLGSGVLATDTTTDGFAALLPP